MWPLWTSTFICVSTVTCQGPLFYPAQRPCRALCWWRASKACCPHFILEPPRLPSAPTPCTGRVWLPSTRWPCPSLLSFRVPTHSRSHTTRPHKSPLSPLVPSSPHFLIGSPHLFKEYEFSKHSFDNSIFFVCFFHWVIKTRLWPSTIPHSIKHSKVNSRVLFV